MKSNHEAFLYSIFGVKLDSNTLLNFPTIRERGKADLRFEIVSHYCKIHNFPDLNPIFKGSIDIKGESLFLIYKNSGEYILRFTEIGNFHLSKHRILFVPNGGKYDMQKVEACLFSSVFSFWMEVFHSIIMLHASSVIIGNTAIGFLGKSGNGKSTIASSFIKAGFNLLTDDIVPIKIISGKPYAYPGFPSIRLWPSEARYFINDITDSSSILLNSGKFRVPIQKRNGDFCPEKKEIRRLYILNRQPVSEKSPLVDFCLVNSRDALIELLCYSFLPRSLSAVGIQQKRIKVLSQVVEQVPIKKINYPSGIQYLQGLREKIVEDITTNQS